MSFKDKMEVGLKPDAPYRPDNLPEIQQDDPDCQEAGEPGDSPRLRGAREACENPAKPGVQQPRPAADPPDRPRRPRRKM
jgi:hypothetical protein